MLSVILVENFRCTECLTYTCSDLSSRISYLMNFDVACVFFSIICYLYFEVCNHARQTFSIQFPILIIKYLICISAWANSQDRCHRCSHRQYISIRTEKLIFTWINFLLERADPYWTLRRHILPEPSNGISYLNPPTAYEPSKEILSEICLKTGIWILNDIKVWEVIFA